MSVQRGRAVAILVAITCFLLLLNVVLIAPISPTTGAALERQTTRANLEAKQSTVATTGIALGAFVSGAPWESAKIDEFTELVGKAPAVLMWYQDWAHPDRRKFDADRMQAIVLRGAMPMVTWEPWDHTGGVAQERYALRTIVAGEHDEFIRDWARSSAEWGGYMYLRFAHEMNGNWYPWSPGVNDNKPGEYVAAWRHVVDIFREEGANNVRWVWSPNITFDRATPFADLYPGDQYVDWVGLDGYNEGTGKSYTNWTQFVDLFGPSYDTLSSLTARPIMIAETASTESGGDKAAWIRRGLLQDLPERFPRVRALIWFHERMHPELDWRIDSSAAALQAFREIANSPTFQARLP